MKYAGRDGEADGIFPGLGHLGDDGEFELGIFLERFWEERKDPLGFGGFFRSERGEG